MIFKHNSNFSDSEVMRELEKLSPKKEETPNVDSIVEEKNKVASSITGDLCNDIITLAVGLRKKGFNKEAEALENDLVLYKTAETHLYRVFDEEGNDLIQFSHPEGEVEVSKAKEGLGNVETQITQHKKIVDVVSKKPTGKQASSKKKDLNKVAQIPVRETEGKIEEENISLKARVNYLTSVINGLFEKPLPYFDVAEAGGELDIFTPGTIKTVVIRYGGKDSGATTELLRYNTKTRDVDVSGFDSKFTNNIIKLYLKINDIGTDIWNNFIRKGGAITSFEDIFGQANLDKFNTYINNIRTGILKGLKELQAIVFAKNEPELSALDAKKMLQVIQSSWKPGERSPTELSLITNFDNENLDILVKAYKNVTNKVSELLSSKAEPQSNVALVSNPFIKPTQQVKAGAIADRVIMRLRVLADLFKTKDPKVVGKIQQAISKASEYKASKANWTAWNLFAEIQAIDPTDVFKNWANYPSVDSWDRDMQNVEAQIKKANRIEILKKLATLGNPPGGGAEPVTPRRSTQKSRLSQDQYNKFRERYKKAKPQAYDAVQSMQTYMSRNASRIEGLLRDRKVDSREIEKIMIALTGTGRGPVSGQSDPNDGIWGRNTTDALKAFSKAMELLGVKIELNISANYKESDASLARIASQNFDKMNAAATQVGVSPEKKEETILYDNVPAERFGLRDQIEYGPTEGGVELYPQDIKGLQEFQNWIIRNNFPKFKVSSGEGGYGLNYVQWKLALRWLVMRADYLANKFDIPGATYPERKPVWKKYWVDAINLYNKFAEASGKLSKVQKLDNFTVITVAMLSQVGAVQVAAPTVPTKKSPIREGEEIEGGEVAMPSVIKAPITWTTINIGALNGLVPQFSNNPLYKQFPTKLIEADDIDRTFLMGDAVVSYMINNPMLHQNLGINISAIESLANQEAQKVSPYAKNIFINEYRNALLVQYISYYLLNSFGQLQQHVAQAVAAYSERPGSKPLTREYNFWMEKIGAVITKLKNLNVSADAAIRRLLSASPQQLYR